MNDDELRSILKSDADRVEVGSDSWSRLESRLSPRPTRSASRAFAFGAIVIGVVVALVVGVIWIGRRDSVTHAASRPQQPMPSRIAAVTADFKLVVLDARTGRTIRTLARNVALHRGSPALALTPDGRSVYYSTYVAIQGGQCPGEDMVLRVTVDGRGRFEEAPGPIVALSPDGRRLAVLGIAPTPLPPGACSSRRQLEIRDLTRGTTQYILIGDGSIDRLSWSSDSISLAFQWLRGTSYAYALNTQTGRALSDAQCLCRQTDGAGWFGYLGTTGDFLGSRAPKVGSRVPSRAVALRADGSVRRTLFRSRGPINELASDRSGDHILALFPKETKPDFFVDSLYRWSKGERNPTKIRDGIVAAAWIPDAPPPPDIAAVRDGRTVVLNSRRGTERDLGASADASQITGAPGGKDVLVGVNTSDECGTANAPHIDRVRVRDGRVTRASSGRFPAVNRSGLVAYEVRCDGVSLGMTDLVSGMSSRSNPLGDGPGEASVNATLVHPVGWSPNGRQLLYWVYVRGKGERYFVGRLEGDPPFLRHITKLPVGPQDSVLSFTDEEHVAVGSWTNGQTTVRRVRIPRGSQRWTTGEVLLRTSGRVTRLDPNRDGRRFLVLMFGGDLFRWTRGDARLTKVASQIEAAAWLGG